MASRSDTSLTALLLTQRLVDTPAAPLKASEYWALLDRVSDPAALLGLDAVAIARAAEVDTALAERLAELLDAASAFAFRLDEAEQSGLRLISSVDDDYPTALVERLGRGAPPLLYAVGDPALLRADLLGVVGSRDVGQAGADMAREAAAAAVAHGCGVISGGAKGVDRLAMAGALDAGGSAVGVLADSLLRLTRESEVRRAVSDGRLCLCSPYKPTAGFTIANAMGRNKIIYALSKATLVVAAESEKGGTWAGAVEALRRRAAPVIAWTGVGAGEGNDLLVKRGAMGLDAVSGLFPLPGPDQLADPDPPPSGERPHQLALEVDE
jgi:predicted Rossmann fold nucleotide-binding protein DprA/Smf involved in DNA uptake